MTAFTTTLNALQALGAVVVAIVTVLRVKLLRGPDLAARLLWGALAALTIGQTLQVSQIYSLVDHTIGVPGSAAVVKHAAALVAAGCTAAVVEHLVAADTGRPRLTFIAVGLTSALALAVLPWIAAPPTTLSPLLTHRAEYYDTSWRSVVHWAAFLGFLGWSLWTASAVCWRFRRRETGKDAASISTRTAVTLVGVGTSVGGLYIAEKVITVAVWASGRPTVGLVLTDEALEALTLAASVSLIAVGTQWEAATRIRRQRSSLRAVRPLQVQLRAKLAIRPLPHAPDAAARLVATMAEVHEGLRRLTGYVPPPADADNDECVVQWLRASLAADVSGPPHHLPSAPPIGDTSSTVAAAQRLSELHRLAMSIPTAEGAAR